MKILKPIVEIKIDILDMTPAEAANVKEICSDMNIKTEWCSADRRGSVAAIFYFDDQEKANLFISIVSGV